MPGCLLVYTIGKCSDKYCYKHVRFHIPMVYLKLYYYLSYFCFTIYLKTDISVQAQKLIELQLPKFVRDWFLKH